MAEINQIVLASNNKGKIKEFTQLFAKYSIDILPQSQFGIESVEEEGLTFVENALLKARYATTLTGLPTIADDSGLLVDALDGAPGIFSARFAGKDASDTQNVEKLLSLLADVPLEKRAAHYLCVIVLLRHREDPEPIICQGIWQGSILTSPRGDKGFGYDPIFYIPRHHCAAAELSLADKNQLSHRGQAMQQLLKAVATPIM